MPETNLNRSGYKNDFIFGCTAESMRKELLELEAKMQSEATDEENYQDAELQCQLLQLLFNPEVTTISFPPGLNAYNNSVAEELLRSLLDFQLLPNVHNLICNGTWDRSPFLVSHLPLFPNLKVLRLAQFECNDSDLCIIATNLPKLR